ncbi:hypothetical protein SG82_09150 [Enterobacter hormaechei subsp. xiangfangensis]|nr:hypothetical protein SG82_09150 [Enterobacter hormaechei subsp. xiangfangensis]RYA52818.1 hypothetical protein DD597_00835 [Enterobacter cloacae complex sp. 677-3DZ2D5B]RYA54779.1 hypothetical protein DD606_10020 [Enterobacter cloacae complex sp. GF14B]RYA63937.1 hypothetical protein DD599_15820 [Enterobacter cloacae complex sp. CH23B]RYA70711.1 hypothetical protein DD598_13350 [Enterobacter cloacae complex sp. 2DZ2F16B1]
MVLLFLSLRWITFSNSASCSVAKDSGLLNYVRMESRINIYKQSLQVKSLGQISFFAILLRILGEFQELSARSVKARLHFVADKLD